MRPVHSPSNPLVWLLLFSLVLAAGCRPAERITSYDAPKLPKKPKPDRMLGAIAFNKDTAWFVKATSTRSDADTLEPAFRGFVGSVGFDESGEPTWKLPEGWTKSDEVVQLRHSTLKATVDDDRTIDVTVSKLPWTGGDQNLFSLNNVNRWRGQLGERPALLVEMLRDVESIKMATGAEATFVRLDGTMKTSRRGMPSGHPPVGSQPGGPAPPANASASGLTFDTPEGWEQQPASGMRKAVFKVSTQGNDALVTVIDLPGNSGTLAENVNRWRGQVLLETEDAKTIGTSAERIDMGGVEGQYVQLVGPKDTILGVIAPAAGKTWFIKLRGPKSLAEGERKRFTEFVRSLRFP